MVSALDSGSGGPGSSPGRGTALCSWARHFTLTVPFSTQVYKLYWQNVGAMDWHPIQGELLLAALCYRNLSTENYEPVGLKRLNSNLFYR